MREIGNELMKDNFAFLPLSPKLFYRQILTPHKKGVHHHVNCFFAQRVTRVGAAPEALQSIGLCL